MAGFQVIPEATAESVITSLTKREVRVGVSAPMIGLLGTEWSFSGSARHLFDPHPPLGELGVERWQTQRLRVVLLPCPQSLSGAACLFLLALPSPTALSTPISISLELICPHLSMAC
jgi:hypothetical protein